MGQSDHDLLLDMGFDERRIKLALKHTGGREFSTHNIKYIQIDALTWLENNQDTSVDELEAKESSSTSTTTTSKKEGSAEDDDEAKEDAEPAPGDAKSYKCNDCGKQLRSWQAVQFHAERTEHQNFDESTEEVAPLTEEEKKAKLEELRERLAEKRKAQAQESVLDAKKNEAIRRKRDQDSERMKEELRKKEQLKEVAARKQEKIDEAKARAKVKAEIAATQQARRDAAAKAKAEREGKPIPSEASAPEVQAPSQAKPAASHTEARLRLQFPPSAGRSPLTKSFPAETTLFEVAAAITEETGIKVNTLTTTFPPRKIYNFSEATDVGLSLKEANLTPSASLIVGPSFDTDDSPLDLLNMLKLT